MSKWKSEGWRRRRRRRRQLDQLVVRKELLVSKKLAYSFRREISPLTEFLAGQSITQEKNGLAGKKEEEEIYCLMTYTPKI